MKKIDFQTQAVQKSRSQYEKLLDTLLTDPDTTLEANATPVTLNVSRQGEIIRQILRHNHLQADVAASLRDKHGKFKKAAHCAITGFYSHTDDIVELAKRSMEALKMDAQTLEEKVGQDSYLNSIYASSRQETRDRYQLMDYLFGVGQDFIFGEQDPIERLVENLSVPEDIRVARWRYMLALADQAYDIGLTDNRTNNMDEKEGIMRHYKLELFSRLFAQLSLHPRGVDNECMPVTHQLRHNPAIHSLHVTALANKFFENAEAEILKNGNGNKRPQLEALARMRKKIMMMALVHDLGESFGELSSVNKLSDMSSDDERSRFNKSRYTVEEEVFNAQLERFHSTVIASREDDAGEHWDRIKTELLDAYQLSERSDCFIGRFFKILERMQSQQDYLRFQGQNGATLLRDASANNKRFTLKYVPELLFGVDMYGSAGVKVAPSLREVANMETDPSYSKAARLLCQEMEREYNGHRTNGRSFCGLNAQLSIACNVDTTSFDQPGHGSGEYVGVGRY